MSLKNLSIKEIYFYLVSLITLLIILFNFQSLLGGVLRYYILDTVPQYSYQPPFLGSAFDASYNGYYEPTKMVEEDSLVTNEDLLKALQSDESLTEAEQAMVDNWFTAYEIWQQDQDSTYKRMMDAFIERIVSLVIFAPIFFYHFKKAREE